MKYYLALIFMEKQGLCFALICTKSQDLQKKNRDFLVPEPSGYLGPVLSCPITGPSGKNFVTYVYG